MGYPENTMGYLRKYYGIPGKYYGWRIDYHITKNIELFRPFGGESSSKIGMFRHFVEDCLYPHPVQEFFDGSITKQYHQYLIV